MKSKLTVRNILYLIVIAIFVLAACGGSSDGNTNNNSNAQTNSTDNQEANTQLEEESYCAGEEDHAFAQGIANSYEVPYEDVIGYFCDGYLFEDILLALETSRQSDRSVEELLEWNLEINWIDIWEELGLND